MPGVEQLLRDGIAAAQSRQFERARPLLERVTIDAPQDPIGWFWRAIASESRADAIASLRRVRAIDASHEQAAQALAKLLLAEAQRIAAGGQHAEAHALAAEASQLTPDAPPVWLALAALTVHPLERIDALRRAVALAPDDAALRTRLRQALLARGMMVSIAREEARDCFREAAVLDPDDARVWQILAKLSDSAAEAAAALRELLRVSPNHTNGRTALRDALVADARTLVQADRLVEACERWREVIALTDGDVEGWLGLAAATADEREAAEAIEAAYARCPDDPRAAEAMERLHPSIDPATTPPPSDAFARFDIDAAAAFEAVDGDPLALVDSSLDTFASQTVAAPARAEQSAEPIAAVAVEPTAAPAVEPTAAVAVEPTVAPVVEPAAALTVEPAAAPVVEPAAAPAAEPIAASRTVMVVDDSPTIRKILGLTLERAGYAVVAEADGESALARLALVKPQLILLDIAMPNLDGYEVCKRIKRDPATKDVPVVMLSGKGALFDKVKGHMAGAAEYLTKPFETPAVLAVVTNYCDRAVAETVNG